MVLALAIGCGGGGSDAARCDDLRGQFDALVSANRSCTVDSDCVWVADGCFETPGCDTFANQSVAAELADLESQGKEACAPCGECLALRPACNNGTCGAKGS